MSLSRREWTIIIVVQVAVFSLWQWSKRPPTIVANNPYAEPDQETASPGHRGKLYAIRRNVKGPYDISDPKHVQQLVDEAARSDTDNRAASAYMAHVLSKEIGIAKAGDRLRIIEEGPDGVVRVEHAKPPVLGARRFWAARNLIEAP